MLIGETIWKFARSQSIPNEDEIVAKWKGDPRKPVVSIFCNTFNHSKFIEDALAGFLLQDTDFPFEILVHDDASTDGTQNVVERVRKLYPRLIKPMYQSENQFSKGHRPSCFQTPRAQGDFIAICEGDDFWLGTKKLQKQVDVLRDDRSLVMTGHDAIVINSDGKVVAESKLSGKGRNYSPDELKKGPFLLTLSVCYRNVVLPEAPERLRVLNGDTFLFSMLGSYGGYHHHSDIENAAYRLHGNSSWSSLDAKTRLTEHKNTYFWMASYYGRINDIKMFHHFQRAYLKCCWALGEVGGRSGKALSRLQRAMPKSW